MKQGDATLPAPERTLATAKVIPLRRRRDETAFLPAALEIVETPAPPLGRAIGATIITFFCVALAWSVFSRIDIVAIASGKVVPSGRVKLIQPLDSGVVKAIYVQDGDHVAKGQVLVELDGTTAAAERDKVARQLLDSRLEAAQLTALQAGLGGGDPEAAFSPPPDTAPYMVMRARSALIARAEEQKAKLAGIDQQIAQKSAEADEVATVIGKLQASTPILAEQVDVRRQAMNIQFGNKLAYLEIEQRLVEQQHDLIAEQNRAVETATAKHALERQREQAQAEYARFVLDNLGGAEQRVAEQTQDLIKAEDRLAETHLAAPIDGTVQQLAIHTVGGVVTPAEPLLVIVPDDSALIIEAMVQNRDVGFVHVGDGAEVKVETFTFTRYGLLHGKIVGISRDTVASDQSRSEDERPGGNGGQHDGGSATGAPVYIARIKLDRDSFLFEGRDHPLGPGMAVTAEIKTGRRRVIDYLLSPIREYQQEALTER